MYYVYTVELTGDFAKRDQASHLSQSGCIVYNTPACLRMFTQAASFDYFANPLSK